MTKFDSKLKTQEFVTDDHKNISFADILTNLPDILKSDDEGQIKGFIDQLNQHCAGKDYIALDDSSKIHQALYQIFRKGYSDFVKEVDFLDKIYELYTTVPALLQEAMQMGLCDLKQLTHLFNLHDETLSFARVFPYFLKDHPDMLKLFVDRGMDLNIRDEDGDSLLISLINEYNSRTYFHSSPDLIKESMAKEQEKKQSLLKNIYFLIDEGADLHHPINSIRAINVLDASLENSQPFEKELVELYKYLAQKIGGNHVCSVHGQTWKTSDVALRNGFFEVAAQLLEGATSHELALINKKLSAGSPIRKAELLLREVIANQKDIKSFLEEISSSGNDYQVGIEDQKIANLAWLHSVMFHDKEAISLLIQQKVPFQQDKASEVSIETIMVSIFDTETLIELSTVFPDIGKAISLSGEGSLMHGIAKSGDFEEFIKYAKLGFDCDVQNDDHVTPIDIIIEKIKWMPDFDEKLEEIKSYSKDPFYTDNDQNFSPDIIYLGIPSYQNFWSSEHIALARVLATKDTSLRPIIFSEADIEKGILSKLNGVLMPGGGDSYPKDIDGAFSLSDFQPSGEIEQAYLKIYEYAYNNSLPFVGMCLGNQYHALSRGHHLSKVIGYADGQAHYGIVQPGTIEYFMMLDDYEKKKYLSDEDFHPEITIEIKTAHNYAIETGVQSGVYSEEGVVQSFASGNHASFQFHPEEYANDPTNKEGANYASWVRQVNIYDSFLGMMKHHKEQVQLAKFLHEGKTWDDFSVNSEEYKMAMGELDKYYSDLEEILSKKAPEYCLTTDHANSYYFEAKIETDFVSDKAVCLLGEKFTYGDVIS